MSTQKKAEKIVANSPCCVCGGTSSKTYFDRRYDKLNYSGEFHMRRCDDCGLLFCSPRLTDQGIAELYDANYYVFQKPDKAYFERTEAIYQRTVALLPKDIHGSEILEVGSGKGYLLAVLKGLGWGTYGIEISEDAADYARTQFGVDTYAGTIESFVESQPGRRFPVVLCIDIIEHVTDPACFVNRLADVTEPGGYLVIDTPNADSARAALEMGKWRGFNPFHIYVFGRFNLTRLLEKTGFTVTEAFTYNNGEAGAATPVKPSFLTRQWRKIFSRKPVYSLQAQDLKSCIEACRSNPDFRSIHDARGSYAARLQGENLVIIAQRNG
jgi:2-polyprenyl-3-methyl-5-hydroxy-6-metoxy-1,4-benzoquinol methylase